MKLALALLSLVACAHAIPVPKDIRTQTAQLDTPTVIVGSSQVDDKSGGGKVTLHLDQRSQIPVSEVPVVTVPKTEQGKESVPQSVQVSEDPKQEPVLTARNEIIPPRREETLRTESVEATPTRTEVDIRDNVAPQIVVQVPSQETPIIRQVVEPQVSQQIVVPVEPEPVVIVEEVAVPVAAPEPVVLFVPQMPLPAQIPIIVEQDIPQAVVQPVAVPDVPQTIAQPVEQPEVPHVAAVVPVLEERSTPVVQTSPVVSDVVPVRESTEPEIKVVPKQGEGARNLKVDQAPVKAPIVVSSIQKQIPVVEVKSEVQQQQQQRQQVVPQEPKLEGKHAVVHEVLPEVKAEPQVVKPQVQVQTVKVPATLEERKSEEPRREEVKPIVRVEQLVVPEQPTRKEPAVIPVARPQETGVRSEVREAAQVRTTVIRPPVHVQPIAVEPIAVPEQVVRKEPVVIAVVQPKESPIRTTEIREPVRTETLAVDSTRPVIPVVHTQQPSLPTTQIRSEPAKVQSFPEEKSL